MDFKETLDWSIESESFDEMLRVFSRVKTFDYVHNMCLSKESSGHVEAYQISSVLNHVGYLTWLKYLSKCNTYVLVPLLETVHLSKQSLCNILWILATRLLNCLQFFYDNNVLSYIYRFKWLDESSYCEY